MPSGGRAFRAPLQPANETRVYYVLDDPSCRFERNAFTFDSLSFCSDSGEKLSYAPIQPGLGFFDRTDQADLLKVHLPYAIQSPMRIASLFLPPLNRDTKFSVLSGLVETDWYPHPVNLVLRIPATGAVHIAKGAVIAQIVFIAQELCRVEPRVVTQSPEIQAHHNALLKWYVAHNQNRSAYKQIAHSRRGRAGKPG